MIHADWGPEGPFLVQTSQTSPQDEAKRHARHQAAVGGWSGEWCLWTFSWASLCTYILSYLEHKVTSSSAGVVGRATVWETAQQASFHWAVQGLPSRQAVWWSHVEPAVVPGESARKLENVKHLTEQWFPATVTVATVVGSLSWEIARRARYFVTRNNGFLFIYLR